MHEHTMQVIASMHGTILARDVTTGALYTVGLDGNQNPMDERAARMMYDPEATDAEIAFILYPAAHGSILAAVAEAIVREARAALRAPDDDGRSWCVSHYLESDDFDNLETAKQHARALVAKYAGHSEYTHVKLNERFEGIDENDRPTVHYGDAIEFSE